MSCEKSVWKKFVFIWITREPTLSPQISKTDRLPVALLAGGLGKRLRELTHGLVPKPLAPMNGRTFLDYKLEWLAAHGLQDVVILVAELGHLIEEHIGDGSQFGLRVQYQHDGDRLLGTGGAIRAALPKLGDAFWITYGDSYLDFDITDAENCWRNTTGSVGLLTVLENKDEWDISNVDVKNGLVDRYEKGQPTGTFRFIDYGMSILRAEHFPDTEEPYELGPVLSPLIAKHRLLAYIVTQRFYAIDTPESLREAEQHLQELLR